MPYVHRYSLGSNKKCFSHLCKIINTMGAQQYITIKNAILLLLRPTSWVVQQLCFNWRGNTARFDPNVALLDFSQSCQQQQTSERPLETLPRPKKPQPTASGKRRRLQFQKEIKIPGYLFFFFKLCRITPQDIFHVSFKNFGISICSNELRNQPMSKACFSCGPRGNFSQNEGPSSSSSTTYHSSNKLLCTVGVKYDKKYNLEEPHFLI